MSRRPFMTTSRTVRLGFRVDRRNAPLAEPVEIPLRHLAICGQTQESGKTTTLEALITRTDVRALTFVTKRGEASFQHQRRLAPYFRDRADWQFVAAILEASRRERLKFERSWIIRASRGAKTLADVQRNVRKAMATAKGLSADVYLTLDAYLDEVVPQIAHVHWATGIALDLGVNVMDLTALSVEMQHLVLKSSIDWVAEHEADTVIVIPEAWKFLPQSRNTPVKMAAVSLIRQGAALDNYLFLDSQDLGGIDKEILRSVPVWILGVQREANEIKRTLANIPAGIAKPSASDIATLGLGQFYACWGTHAVKTYAQPIWLPAATAMRVATGELSAYEAAGRYAPKEKKPVDLEQEVIALRAENATLRQRLELYEKNQAAVGRDALPERPHPEPARAVRSDRSAPVSDQQARGSESAETPRHETIPLAPTIPLADLDAIYKAVKARLAEEAPELMRVLVRAPEIELHITRHTIEVDGDTLRGRIARLIADGFFGVARTSADIGNELKKSGTLPSNIELGNELKNLMRMGFFTRDNKWLTLVPDMKVRVVEHEAA